ncbi:MAG: metal-sensitive transcriptional regulator [Candidatus Colwellbacteria bacterium]|nr:metal-sensitive transcriptional regulator [Candidatus Colwellbacteria bacterium]
MPKKIARKKVGRRGAGERKKRGSSERAIRRLSIIEGQVRGLKRLVAEGAYCIDLINQSSAIRKALAGVENLILENHLATHVVEQIRSGRERQAIREILSVRELSDRK